MTRRLCILCWLACAPVAAQEGAPSGAVPGGPTDGEPTAAAPAEAEAPATRELEALGSAVDRLAGDARKQGLSLLAAHDYAKALPALEQAHAMLPEDREVALALADLHALAGDRERSERLYRALLVEAPDHTQALSGLSRVLSGPDASAARLREASALLARVEELTGGDPELTLQRARVAAALGDFDQADAAYQRHLRSRQPDDTLALELGDFYRSFGRDDEALRWLREVERSSREGREAASRIFELELSREARRFGLSGDTTAVPQRARELTERARRAITGGDARAARGLAEQAVALSPGYAPARAALGEALLALGKRDAAERALLRALAIDGSLTDSHRRLAELYAESGDPADQALAALLFARVLSQRPDLWTLHLPAARARRSVGDFPRALSHVDQFLARVGDGESEARREAERLATTLRALIGEGGAPADAPPAGGGDAVARARAHLARGEAEAALAALHRGAGRAPTREASSLEATILAAAGRAPEAIRVLERSLERVSRAPETHLQLAQLLLDAGEPIRARRHLLQAERLGASGARYALARLDAEPDRFVSDVSRPIGLLHAHERLTRYLEDPGGEHVQDARRLRGRVGERLTGVAATYGAGLVLLIALWWLYRARRFGGADLSDLLERAPDAGPDVQRVLGAIRHEVLKHNTLMVSGLAQALREGRPAAEQAAHLGRALFGDRGDGGAWSRLRGYAEQLEQLGRAHGLRLNLERRDPALSAILEGFDALRAERRKLRRVGELSGFGKRRLARRLSRAAEVLNGEGLAELDLLLSEVESLEVTAELLGEIFERVRNEPALASREVQPLRLQADGTLPCSLSITRGAFEDAVANLLRNAIQASLAAGAEPVEVGVSVALEVDEVTGLESVLFDVRDRAPGAPSLEGLDASPGNHGLSLTQSALSRYDGSLELAGAAGGFDKAVRIRLPLSAER